MSFIPPTDALNLVHTASRDLVVLIALDTNFDPHVRVLYLANVRTGERLRIGTKKMQAEELCWSLNRIKKYLDR